jgi:hypothetical protein
MTQPDKKPPITSGLKATSGAAKSAPVSRPQMPGAAGPRVRPASPTDAMPPPSAAQELANALAQTSWETGDANADDLSVLAPEAPKSMLGRTAKRSERDPLYARRTMIPILLTMGLILISAAAWIMIAGPESAIGDFVPHWGPVVLCGLGAITEILGVLNMVSVKNAIGSQSPR